jgi:hypothetical protein
MRLEHRCGELQRQLEAESQRLLTTPDHVCTRPPSLQPPINPDPPASQGNINITKKARKAQDFLWTGARDLLDEAKTIDIGNGVKLNVGDKKLP